MRVLIVVFSLVFTVSVFGPISPAHALLTTGDQYYDGSGDMNDIANWIFGDGQGDDTVTVETDSVSAVIAITGDPNAYLLEKWEGSNNDIIITPTIQDGSEIYAGNWEYTGTSVVAYLAIKAGSVWALFDYTNSVSDPNMGYFDVACLFALTAANTACNDLTQLDLEAIFGTGFGSANDRDNAMSHISAYAPLPGAVWLFLSALAGLFGIGFARRRAV